MVQLDQLISPLCLTTRENEFLEHVAVGASAKEAAHENIRLNIHAENRAHMVMCAMLFDVLKLKTPDPAAYQSQIDGRWAPGASDPAQFGLNMRLN